MYFSSERQHNATFHPKGIFRCHWLSMFTFLFTFLFTWKVLWDLNLDLNLAINLDLCKHEIYIYICMYKKKLTTIKQYSTNNIYWLQVRVLAVQRARTYGENKIK